MKPLVSIIIPAYNAENCIAVCFDRLIGQTYSDIEIIVVDDASGDRTVEVCERFAKADSRIKLVKASHGGASHARNVGIDCASGEYITFVDSDDFIETNLIEMYVSAFETWQENAAIAITGMIWEEEMNRFAPRTVRLLEIEQGYIPGELYLLKRNDTATLSWLKLFNFITNKCYRASVIKNNNIRFDENIHIAEDMKFNVDYLNHTKGLLGVINRPLYHYVKHGVSLSSTYYDGAIQAVKEGYQMLLDYTVNQPGVTVDDVYVIKSIYLMDWVSRLCALLDDDNVNDMTKRQKFAFANDEIGGLEFKRLLKDSKMGNKITRYRFYSLKLGRFAVFYFLRRIYQKLKINRKTKGDMSKQ